MQILLYNKPNFLQILYINKPNFLQIQFNILKYLLFENVFAQMLVANSFEPYYYFWEQETSGVKKRFEIDFIIYKGGKTIPFEVKLRNVSSKESLDEFRKKFVKKIGEKYIVHIKHLFYGDNLTYLPYYMLFAVK